jgi:pimeloyl-ACP methyl ester carboxylesterase
MALEPASASDLKTYMGEAAFAEYQKIAEASLPKSRLSIDAPENLIFLPGVMGSLLVSEKGGGVWWIDVRTRNYLDKLGLNADGTDDADKNNYIRASTTDITYDPFFAAVLERKDFNHVIFPFDWRKSLVHSAEKLRDTILETFQNNGNLPVHLVGHSMGGLMLRTALMLHGDEISHAIGRIAFLGTPHYGSPAIASYLKNHLWGFDFRALLGRYISRETFRTLRGVLGMMPAPRGVYPGTRGGEDQWNSGSSDDPYIHPCANFDMYDAKEWKLDLTAEQETALQNVLDDTAEFHHRMYSAHNSLDQRFRDKMAVVAGVGFNTLFRLQYDTHLWGLWERTVKVSERMQGDVHREGDSTVPLASAALENVGEMRYVKGEHGQLPMIPAVYEDVFRWLNGDQMELSTTPAGALAARLSGETNESFAPALTSFMKNEAADEIDYWVDDSSDKEHKKIQQERIDRLQKQLDDGQLPEFIKVKIL